MTTTTFKHCYRTLHVSSDCSWTELRLAYRRRVRSCHPDRMAATADHGSERDDEFKEVVRAFRALAAFHRRHGELPPPWLTVAADAPPPHVRADAAATEPREKQRRRLHARGKRDWRMPRLHKAVVSAFLLGVATSAILGHLGNSYSAHAQPTRTGKIAVGMDPQSVVEVQGVPSYTSGSVWFYGESGIIFERGCVVGWENQPPFPLRTLSGMSYLSRTAAQSAGCATESY